MSENEVISYSNIIIHVLLMTEIILMFEFELFVSSISVIYRIIGSDIRGVPWNHFIEMPQKVCGEMGKMGMSANEKNEAFQKIRT